MITDLEADLDKLKNPKQAKTLSGFFKNNNNIFYGIYAKDLKNLVKTYYAQITLQEITDLLKSNVQEKKQLACYALIQKYVDNKEKIFNFYLKNLRFFNDWALIDTTCINIVGDYLIKKDKNIIYTLASSSKWNEKRISIVSCLAFIRQNDFTDILKISKSLIQDENDLIQKAIGWMLREVGKRDKNVLLDFLNKNIKKIQRITLRYALEKFPKQERDYWYAK